MKITCNIYNCLTKSLFGTDKEKEVEKWMWRKYPGKDRAKYMVTCIWVESSKSDPLRVNDVRGVQNIILVV